jgi:undecaprenyl diphosphate synthase
MDGNGRWAQERGLSRGEGHQQGAVAAKRIVELSLRAGIPHLTLFAFSSENWRRPQAEVELLMGLFVQRLEAELPGLLEQRIRLQVVGNRANFSAELIKIINRVETETAHGDALSLQVAADYGGRWDITQAARSLARQVAAGELQPEQIDEAVFESALALSPVPDPDLLIRTGGECRISNFLLWQCAYSELYFTDICWPDFDEQAFNGALGWYAQRSRRFGRIQEQVAPRQAG